MAGAHIVHIIDGDLLFEFGADKRGILVGESNIIVDDSNIATTQSESVRRGGNIQETICFAGVLSRNRERRYGYNDQGRNERFEQIHQ